MSVSSMTVLADWYMQGKVVSKQETDYGMTIPTENLF